MKNTMRYVITGSVAGLGIVAVLCGVMMLTGALPTGKQIPQGEPQVTAEAHEVSGESQETYGDGDVQSEPDDGAIPVNIVSEDAPVPEKLRTKSHQPCAAQKLDRLRSTE